MTRINSAIPPRCLTDEHLLAEHREIKRLPYCLRKAIASGSVRRIPEKFTLGTGHVLFFVDKMGFALRRYQAIYTECQSRHFYVNNYEENFVYGIPPGFSNDYTPTQAEHDLLVQRIAERIMKSKKRYWLYYGESISKERAVRLLESMNLYL